MKTLTFFWLIVIMSLLSCTGDDDIVDFENDDETITSIRLSFEPEGGGTTVTANWDDPDGPGTQNPVIDDITLKANTAYTLNIEFFNGNEDLTNEIRMEGLQHMIYFGWDNGIFSEPEGSGNILTRTAGDPEVIYQDADGDSLPIGLKTRWKTATEAKTGVFSILLKHQPNLKSGTSGSSVGETDVSSSFNITVN